MPFVKDLQNGIFELDYRDEPVVEIKHVHQTRLMLDRIAPRGKPAFLLINCTGCAYDTLAENTRLQNSVYTVVCSAYVMRKEDRASAEAFRKKYRLGWQAEYFEDRDAALDWILQQKQNYTGQV